MTVGAGVPKLAVSGYGWFIWEFPRLSIQMILK